MQYDIRATGKHTLMDASFPPWNTWTRPWIACLAATLAGRNKCFRKATTTAYRYVSYEPDIVWC